MRLDYASQLWLEKEIKSVANVTRRDVREFLDLAAAPPARGAPETSPLEPAVEELPLEEANRALRDLRAGRIRGAKVLRVS
jgi:propanol-preferring alcohol dehydrogenase